MNSVLIVEDEVFLLRELVETVAWGRNGFYVAGTASTAEEALLLYSALKPELIITDIRLPGGNGLEMLESCSPRASIVITGHDDFGYARKALRLGVSDFLLKPIDDAELEQALRRVQLRLARGRKERPGNRPLMCGIGLSSSRLRNKFQGKACSCCGGLHQKAVPRRHFACRDCQGAGAERKLSFQNNKGAAEQNLCGDSDRIPP